MNAGQTLAYDRHWAVAHEGAKFQGQPDGWQRKLNFLRGVTNPALMAIRAAYDAQTGMLTLSHPDAADITLNPDRDSARLLAWLSPLWGPDLPAPRNLVSLQGQAMTDVPEAFVSVLSVASLRALGEHAGTPLSPHRFRGNLWIDGWAPFEEFALIGRRIRIGAAELEIRERITRCKATLANPETGKRDVDVLTLLNQNYGHQDFGIYAMITRDGKIAQGDEVEIL